MRYFYTALIMICVAVVSLAGLRGGFSRRPPIELFADMTRQPKVRPQTPSEFFADHLNSRTNVPGTVSRAMFNQKTATKLDDCALNTGRLTGTTNWVPTNPLPITRALLDRGQERYQISCTPCHGAAGDSRGITMKYNMVAMANFHDKRLIDMTDGEVFNTITHGKVLMGAYGPNITVEDRWAIVAYLRVLQRSQLATIEDVPKALWPMFGK